MTCSDVHSLAMDTSCPLFGSRGSLLTSRVWYDVLVEVSTCTPFFGEVSCSCWCPDRKADKG